MRGFGGSGFNAPGTGAVPGGGGMGGGMGGGAGVGPQMPLNRQSGNWGAFMGQRGEEYALMRAEQQCAQGSGAACQLAQQLRQKMMQPKYGMGRSAPGGLGGMGSVLGAMYGGTPGGGGSMGSWKR